MNFFISLFTTDSVAHAVLVLSLVSLGGLALGQFRLFRINLGIAGVLFTGLLFGYYHLTLNDAVLEFCRDFGLILFVYAIGMQVGPSFFSSFRRHGLPLNIVAFVIVLLGVLVTLVLMRLAHIPALVAVGLYSGGVTNAPSLGAAQQILKDIPGLPADALAQPALGLALAYPFGILGTILAMVAARWMLRIDLKQEIAQEQRQKSAETAPLFALNMQVRNPNLESRRLDEIPGWNQTGVVVSRLWHAGQLELATPESVLHWGDVLLVVGPKDRLDSLQMIVGSPAEIDLRTVPGDITTERAMVTAKVSVGRTLQDLDFLNRYGVTLTRVMRGGVELSASPSLRLQFGDTVLLVGEKASILQTSRELGNTPQHLQTPQLIPMFIGMGLGVIVGSIPFHIPGLPAAVKLGLAGGPLIVAMILSRIGRVGPVVWYMPLGANLMLREFGLVLFLACVGLRAGPPFFQTLVSGAGWLWMGYATLITLLPLLIGAVLARRFYKVNYLSLCGFLAGSMNSPTLAFANALTPSDAPALAFATVYPLVMLLRVLSAQVLTLIALR